jgi:hypothetical protein
MAIKLFMDQHIPGPITAGLRLRGIDVLTAFEDGSHRLEDPDLLDRATELGRVLFTEDDDLLVIAHERQISRIDFAGLIYTHQQRITIGKAIEDLELLAKCADPEDFLNEVQFIPLK